MKLTVIGLSITSSRSNGHATIFRALLKAFRDRGHQIDFLEKNVPYYARHRDLADPDFCNVILYKDFNELKEEHSDIIRKADAVMVGSYVQEGVAVNELVFSIAEGMTIFYDIDTPVTLAKLEAEEFEYIRPGQVRCFDLYLSFSGGAILDLLMDHYKSPSAKPLYCSVDPELYYPEHFDKKWQLGYLGTYSPDCQPALEELLNQSARYLSEKAFVVAGPQYPKDYVWPSNVERIAHLPPDHHRAFYNAQKYTLNVTRQDMIRAGYSPSVRLFEAAACGVPVISDYWEGLDTFFTFGKEILIAKNWKETVGFMVGISEEERIAIGDRARKKVKQRHTSKVRAEELEHYIVSVPSTADNIKR